MDTSQDNAGEHSRAQPFTLETIGKEKSDNNLPWWSENNVIYLGSVDETQKTVGDIGALQKWPSPLSLKNVEFENYKREMEEKGLKFELPTNSLLRATEFKPFWLCCLMRCGKTLKTGPHNRGFWFATVSFFLAFFGWFSMAPVLVLIREDIGICDNQAEVDGGTASCICKESCRNTIGKLKIVSLCSNVIARLLLAWLVEIFGPRNVQCTLLVLGSMFVGSVSLIGTGSNMIAAGILTGTIGAAFIPNQFWMALLFGPGILGLVSCTAAGWGNLGGGVANMLMPQFYEWTKNWRTAFVIPAAFLLLWAFLMFFYSQDTPMGKMVVERDLKKKQTSPIDFLICLLDYRVCILAIQYGACFGAELIMNWELATHFYDYFDMSVTNAGWLSSGFGVMNIFAPSLGGLLSDKLNIKMGLRGRLLVQFILLFCQGVCLLVFGFMSNWEGALFVMLCLSIFSLGAAGSTFSLVPYVVPENIGIVSAIIGAGGNLFAALTQAVFYMNISDDLLPFRLHSTFVFVGAFLTFLISFELQGSLFSKPSLANYCHENIFTYVLQWELQFDSSYRVIGTYVSPNYLLTDDNQEHYVGTRKQLGVEYGEGVVGAIGECRRSCMVPQISDVLAGESQVGATKDSINTVLFFPTANGKRVIEVGGSTTYELAEGGSLRQIELILTGKDETKDLRACLREVGTLM